MNKQINTAVATAVIIIITGALGILIWLGGNNQKQPQSTVGKDSKTLANKEKDNATKTALTGVVYKLGDDIVSYNPENQQEKIIFSSNKLIDFDISQDGKYLTYSLKDDGFTGNADIYFLDITNQKTIRLTEKNNMASLSPKIYSNGKKVAYLRRTFDAKKGKLRDGEIWTINADGNVNSSAKLFGDESKSWFELDPETRCCSTCEGEDKPYEPENMMIFNSISEDGNFISYKAGSFGLMCFAGFQMYDMLYDVRKKEAVGGTEILQSKNNEYYAQMYSAFPPDPFPFCIKNTFFDKNGKIVWEPEKGIANDCQHDYYYKPLDFEINGNEIKMTFLKESNDTIVLSQNSFVLNSDIKDYLTQENSGDIFYTPKVYYTEDGEYINYSDNILSAKQIGNYVIFTEKKFKSEYPTLNIMDTNTKNIQKTINLDNNQNFSVVLSD